MQTAKPLFGEKIGASYSNLLIFARSFFQIFGFFGLVFFFGRYLGLNKFRQNPNLIPKRYQSLDFFGIGIAAVIIGFIVRTSGTLSQSYNPERVAIQIVIVLLVPTAVAIEYVLFRKKYIQIFLAVPMLFFLMTLLLQSTSIGGYITGSDVTRISNLQSDYSPFIISEGERNASRWLSKNTPSNSYLQTDSRGFLVLLQNGRRSQSKSLDPVNLKKGSFIYAANSNVIGGVARSQTFIIFPKDYIDQHYKTVYSSKRARIYH
jgi:hypothetical protein